MRKMNQRKRRNLLKMTVQAYACLCGTPLDCQIACPGYDAMYLKKASGYANGMKGAKA